jgi:NDP-sugar pyrophosphorylase family protein
LQTIDTAMIFAAGMGTRFKPWTDHHPKALAVVNGKTLLQRNVEYLAGFEIKNVIINVHHFAEQIMEEVDKQKGWGSRITISDEREQLLETGGGLLKARKLLELAGRFITINADILTDLDLTRLISFHEKESALISFGVTSRPSTRELLFDADRQLKGWKNNATGEIRMVKGVPPEKAASLKAMAYSCVTVMESRVFSLITQKGKFSLIDTYLDLASSQRIKGFDHSGDKLVDVGKTESIAVAEKLFQ